MKTDALTALTTQLARGPASLTIADGADFGAKLTLGQIIKGRVLRSYDGNRHLVDFGGQERVVDSSVPLRPDEVFRGRVIGLGERVELQKLPAAATEAPAESAAPAGSGPTLRGDGSVRDLFARYGARVDAQALELLQQVAARQADPQATALAGLVLAKQGLPMAPEWLRLLQARLGAVADSAPAPGTTALHLETVPPTKAPMLEVVQPPGTVLPDARTELVPTLPTLALALQNLLLDSPLAPWRTARDDAGASEGATGGDADRGGRSADDARTAALADWILNGQTGGPVAHRLGMLQLVVDGRLLELEIALFEEAGDRDGSAAEEPATRHRQIVLSLDTEALGRVDVNARLAGRHLQVELATASGEATGALALHSHRLEQDLRGLGWDVDGLVYETRVAGATGRPATSVVEHIINPGSVSRLV
ncbi:MAG: flagellar hook-length control protein FliK [Rhizobacter sp.]